MRRIKYLRIYSDDQACSRFEEKEIDLNSTEYAPPAPNLNTSRMEVSSRYLFLELPVGWYGDWHPTPVRQWLAVLSGECEFETGDGNKKIQKAGDLVFLEDMSGKGHQIKVLGSDSVRMLAVHIP